MGRNWQQARSVWVQVKWPVYCYGEYVTPGREWFAWYPVQTWDGKWVWLRGIYRRKVQKKQHLDGPDWSFWCYSDWERYQWQ